MNIAFCFNSLGLSGLGVTVSSLIRNCSSPEKLKLWFLGANLTALDKEKIGKLLKVEDFNGYFKLLDFDPKFHFGFLNSLHGGWTTYGRLLLPELINDDLVLYLDSDLVVEVDVLDIANFNFGENILAAVGGGQFKFSLGYKFYINKIKISPDTEYFNAGVLLLNLRLWRLKNVKQSCLQIAKQHPEGLPSHDQSLLNIYCAGNFAKLPLNFNCRWIADKPKPTTAEKMILHFEGSPKPWDPLGFLIHNGYNTWSKYLIPGWITINDKLALTNLKRVWQIRRSYIRCILDKVRG